MSDAEARPSQSSRAIEPLIQPTIRVILALVILGVIQFLVVRVPGVERVMLEPDITVATVIYSVITIVMFGAVMNYASSIGSALAGMFESFPELERIVQLIGVLIILVWAYQIFWWVPYFRTNQTQYDYLFLVMGIIFIAWLGYILYSNVDKMSALLTGQVIEEIGDQGTTTDDPMVEEEPAAADPVSETGGADQGTCPECGADVSEDGNFCTSCGASLDQSGQL